MNAAPMLLAVLAVGASVGCDTNQGGKGVTEPSPNYQGVEQPPPTRPSAENLAKQPTQPADAGQNTLQAESPIAPEKDDPDKAGTTRLVDTTDGGAATGVTSAPSRATGAGDKTR